MEAFNKNAFIQDLTDFLKSEYENGNDTDIYILIYEYIDNETLYTSDCWDICKKLNAYDFTAYEMNCNNINELAYCALSELANNELDFNYFEKLIKEKNNN